MIAACCFPWIFIEKTNKIDKFASRISIWAAEATPLASSQDKSFVKKFNSQHFGFAKFSQCFSGKPWKIWHTLT